MLNEEDRRKAGALMTSLVDRQKNMKSDDPFALMKELTETFNQTNSSNAYDLGSGGFKSLINKPSNATDLYQKNFVSEGPKLNNFRGAGTTTFPSTFDVSDDL